jgi:hypothetical protein
MTSSKRSLAGYEQLFDICPGRGLRPFLGALLTDVIDKSPPQQAGRHFEEMLAILPVYRAQPHQLQKDLVHQRRRLQAEFR